MEFAGLTNHELENARRIATVLGLTESLHILLRMSLTQIGSEFAKKQAEVMVKDGWSYC